MEQRSADQQSQLVDELSRMRYEPLLPVEKKLIVISLISGVALLVLLAWISLTFFKVS